MVMRIGGLASGMDIDSLVEKLMQAERAPLYKLQQKKSSYEWQRDAYRGVNTKLKAFSDTYLFDNFVLSSNFVKKSTTINGANKDKLSITASSSASGSLNIQSVDKLASAATTGAKSLQSTTYRNAKGTDSLGDLGIFPSGETTKTLKFNIDGETTPKEITINTTTTVDEFITDLKSAGFTNAKYNESTGRFELGATNTSIKIADESTANSLKELGFTTSFNSTALKVGDDLATKATKVSELNIQLPTSFDYQLDGGAKAIDFSNLTNDSTIEEVLAKFNEVGTGLSASFDANKGTISIKTTDNKKFEVNDTNREFLKDLGIEQSVGGSSIAFNEVAITDNNEKITPKGDSLLKHLGVLDDGKFKLNVVQADGSMKETIIEFKATDSISSLVKKINGSGAGVTALFADGKMSISANNTGTNNKGASADIQLSTEFVVDENSTTDTAGVDLFKQLGFIDPLVNPNSDTKFDLSNKGTNAEYTVNGITMTSQSNSINIEGYTIKLQGTFVNDGQGVSVTAANDVDAMMEKIKEFVKTYNGLITDLNSSLQEKKYREYAPLTSEQREAMSENEIKLWEEKAKSGLLRNDSIIRDGISKMRATFSNNVGGLADKTVDSLYEIGVTTSKNYNDGGTLVIDENKLRAALEKNPDQVAQIFIGKGKANDTETDPLTGETKTVDTRGIVQRLRESIDTFELNIEKKAGRSTMTDAQYSIGKSLTDTEKRISTWQDKLKDIEARYWKQFTAMEQAINKANQQSGMFMQGGGF